MPTPTPLPPPTPAPKEAANGGRRDTMLNVLLQSTSDPILVLDAEGHCCFVNMAFEHYTGWGSAHCRQQADYADQLIHPDDQAVWRHAVEATVAGQPTEWREIRWLGAAGFYQWFDIRFDPLDVEVKDTSRILVVARHIHRRKEHERQWRQQPRTLEQRHERAQILIAKFKHFMGQASGLPADVTAYCEGICRILHDMYRADLVYIFLPGDNRTFLVQSSRSSAELPPLPASVQQAVLQSAAPLYCNALNLTDPYRSDPAVRQAGYVTYLGAPLRDSSGQLRGVLGLLDKQKKYYDHAEVELITIAALHVAARLRAEDQLAENRALTDHLRHAQKMEAVGLLAGGIAHDFNNILSGILGFASHVKSQMQAGTKWHRDLQLIEDSAMRAADLTQQLLAFARRKHFAKEPVAINQVLEDVVRLVRRSVGRERVMETSLHPANPVVQGDAGQLNQAIMNLCLNGVAATQDRAAGRLQLRVDVRPLTAYERKLLDVSTTEPHVCLYCQDNGSGIPADQLEHIFEPFYTTRSAAGGTGLGLAIVYGIITNHGGHIRVESVQGEGTTFICYLPSGEGNSSKTTTTVATPVDGTETVLVVDDELVVRSLVEEVLTAHGYTVLLADSGLAALASLDQARGGIDLVLLDMVMPGLDGERTFRALRAVVPDQPILLTSGYVQAEKTERLLAAGALGVIAKPYTANDLLHQIREALDRGQRRHSD